MLNRPSYAYPAIVVFIFVVLVALGINGSSVGVYHQSLYGGGVRDNNLLYGKPQLIRSDEWVNWSVLTASQPENDFRKYNPDLSTGQNLALQPEVPTKDWSTIFRPHNWGFFILPFINGFAFRWWFLMVVLLISTYFFALRHLKQQSLAILFSVAAGASPFILWWYQTASVGVLAYGFVFLTVFDRLFTDGKILPLKDRRLRFAAETGLVAFLLMAFALLFYPPFQIPIGVVLLFYFLTHLVSAFLQRKTSAWSVLVPLLPLGASLVITVALGIIFIRQNNDVISALTQSVYPGKRVIESGGLRPAHLFNGFAQPVLQSYSRASHYFTNQSEASNFILIAPFLVLPSLLLTYMSWRRKVNPDWLLLGITLCVLFILCRLLIPGGEPIYKLFLLDKVPPQRLLIGLGFAGLVQVVLLLRSFMTIEPLRRRRASLLAKTVYLAICASIIAYFSFAMRQAYPLFLTSDILAIGLVFSFCSIIGFLLFNRPLLALGALAVFSFGSSFKILPLYHGLGELTQGKLVREMDAVSSKRTTWATVDYSTFEGIASVVGDTTVTGVNTYPDAKFWEHAVGKQYEGIYNRQAHVIFSSDQSIPTPIRLTLNSSYVITANCNLYRNLKIHYILAPGALHQECLELNKTVSYPNVIFFIYHVVER